MKHQFQHISVRFNFNDDKGYIFTILSQKIENAANMKSLENIFHWYNSTVQDIMVSFI